MVDTAFGGDSFLMAGGAMAHHGELRLAFVGVVAFLGAVAGDLLWFEVGRRFGRAFIQKRPKLAEHTARIQRGVDRFGAWFVFGFRFIYGIRTATPVLLGASGYPLRKFFWLNALGGLVWTVVFAAIGWGLGSGLTTLLGRHGRLEEVLAAAVLLTVVLWAVWAVVTKRRRRAAVAGGRERLKQV